MSVLAFSIPPSETFTRRHCARSSMARPLCVSAPVLISRRILYVVPACALCTSLPNRSSIPANRFCQRPLLEDEFQIAALSEGQLESLFRRLNLAHTRRIYQDLAARAEKENWSYRVFLLLCWPKKWLIPSKRACNVLPASPFPLSSRPLRSSTSVWRRHCVRPCSVPTSGPN